MFGDPRVDCRAEHRQRDAAVGKQSIVECFDVEALAELVFGLAAQALDLEAAEQVGRGLAGHRGVTVDLRRRPVRADRGVLEHVVDCLLPAPAHDVQARVDDEARSAPGFVRQLADARDRARIQAHLVGEVLAVEAPALGRARYEHVAQDRMQPLVEQCNRHLQMVAGIAFVKGQRLGAGLADRRRVVRADLDRARPAAVGRACRVEAAARVLLVGRRRDHDDLGVGHVAEPVVHGRAAAIDGVDNEVEHGLLGRKRVLGVRAQVLHERPEILGAERVPRDLPHLGLNPGHLRQAEPMDLFGSHRE